MACISTTSPYFTGPLLWVLCGAPSSIQYPVYRLLGRLGPFLFAPRAIFAVKCLFGIGILRKVNNWLNRVATNGWRVRDDKARWDWSKEIAVVTGGCSGIGEIVVKGLVARGVRVVILDVQPLPERLENNNIFYFHCDISNSEAVLKAAEEVKSLVGNPSILVNNAGIGSGSTILETTPEHLHKIFGVNLLSFWFTCAAFLPHMVQENKGHIVTVASLASFVAAPNRVDYTSTKAGALAFHEGLTLELLHNYNAPNVHTTICHPSLTTTPLLSEFTGDIEKMKPILLSAESVGGEILDGIFSCRGGQIILPRSFSALSGLRGWPHWIQQWVRDQGAEK